MGSISPRFFAGHGMPCPYGKKLAAEGDAASDDCRNWGAAKRAAVKGRVAGFAGGFGRAKSPFVIGRENCDVGGLTGGDCSLDAENACGTGGEQFDQTHQRKSSGVDEFAQAESERGFEADDPEGRTVEFDVLACGMVRGVVGGDRVHAAV